MVHAILDRRKTQTRRVIKDKDITNNFDIDVDGSVYAYIDQATGDSYPPTAIAKYQVGDILWVRETWSRDESGEYVYRTNYGTTEDDSFPPSMFKWKPSIHMPRDAARIFLKVTNVRVERLQDITEEDAIAEGVSWLDEACYSNNGWTPTLYDPDSGGSPVFRDGFTALWDSINAKRGYSWDTNPWVWVYEFEKISKEEAEEWKRNFDLGE
jgi:hypothetical protein